MSPAHPVSRGEGWELLIADSRFLIRLERRQGRPDVLLDRNRAAPAGVVRLAQLHPPAREDVPVLAPAPRDADREREVVDVDAFLATTGSSLMTHLSLVTGPFQDADTLASRLAALENTEVELVETSGDRATVRVTPPGGSPTDVEMTRVDGRWLPSDLPSQWNDMIEAAEARIDALSSEQAAQTRMQVRMALGMAEGLIDQLAVDVEVAIVDLHQITG